MTARVAYERSGEVAVITMDDGKANALSFEMLAELDTAIQRAHADRAAIVLTGREGVLSGGFDLKILRAGGDDAARLVRGGFELITRLWAYPLPLVVACPGHAVALGAFIALTGEVRLCAHGAFKIGANEVMIGLTMPHLATTLCRERLSPTHFHRAVVLSEMFDPAGAVSAGFFDQAVPATELADVAREAVTRLLQLDKAAHAATKARIRRDAFERMQSALELDAAELRLRA